MNLRMIFKAISPAPEPVANNLTLQDMVKLSNNKTQQNTILCIMLMYWVNRTELGAVYYTQLKP